jgi:hypothetical protein
MNQHIPGRCTAWTSTHSYCAPSNAFQPTPSGKSVCAAWNSDHSLNPHLPGCHLPTHPHYKHQQPQLFPAQPRFNNSKPCCTSLLGRGGLGRGGAGGDKTTAPTHHTCSANATVLSCMTRPFASMVPWLVPPQGRSASCFLDPVHRVRGRSSATSGHKPEGPSPHDAS